MLDCLCEREEMISLPMQSLCQQSSDAYVLPSHSRCTCGNQTPSRISCIVQNQAVRAPCAMMVETSPSWTKNHLPDFSRCRDIAR